MTDEALPRIVVTRSFNQGEFIEATPRSILDQDHPNLEHLVLDGGSTYVSVDIIRRYESQLTYWHSRKDAGQADAIATGFEMATAHTRRVVAAIAAAPANDAAHRRRRSSRRLRSG